MPCAVIQNLHTRKTDASTARLITLPNSSVGSPFPEPPRNGDGDGEEGEVIFDVEFRAPVEFVEIPLKG